MITVSLNEANFEYDIHSLVKAFYPKEEVKVFADSEKINKLEKEKTPLFHMEVSYIYADILHSPEQEKEQSHEGEKTDRIEIRLFTPVISAGLLGDKSCENSRNGKPLEGNSYSDKSCENSRNGKPPKGNSYSDKSCENSRNGKPLEENSFSEKGCKKQPIGIPFSEGSYEKRAEVFVKTDFTDRKETKNRLKQSLYQMLKDYTGTELPWGTLTGIRPTKIPMSMLENGEKEEDIKAYMQETYFASEAKIDLSMEIAKRELELLKKLDYENGYSLYIGIPFCPSICSYCSFSSSPLGLWKEKVDAYLDALEKEIEFTAEACRNKKLNTIYIGGGTPTTLEPEQLDRLLTKVEQSFDFSHLLEYTVEAGRPDSITREKLLVLQKHDISRISINPQTMKQETLNIIGRHHTVEQTEESFRLARELGFENINMDLIVGLPEETLEDVQNTMERIMALDPDNLTVHSLAIKRAARLRMFKEEYEGMHMTNSWEIIDLTASYARKMGQEPYYLYRQKNMAGNFENVGYAKPGKAGIYNILIMEEKQTIMALGAGATTKYVFDQGRRIERSENVKDITNYLERIDEMLERKRESMKLYMSSSNG